MQTTNGKGWYHCPHAPPLRADRRFDPAPRVPAALQRNGVDVRPGELGRVRRPVAELAAGRPALPARAQNPRGRARDGELTAGFDRAGLRASGVRPVESDGGYRPAETAGARTR